MSGSGIWVSGHASSSHRIISRRGGGSVSGFSSGKVVGGMR